MMASGSGAPVPIFYDYLETTDAYAFIDTGVSYKDSTGLKVDITAFPTTITGTNSIPIGMRSNASNNSRVWFAYFTSSGSSGLGYASARSFNYAFLASDAKVRMVTSMKSKSQKADVYHGTKAVKSYSYTYTSTVIKDGNLTLFKARVGTSGTTLDSYVGGVRMWGCKIYSNADSSTLVRDFRPCTYNGVAGMWDMVTNQFFGNANTQGSFSVGND